MDLIGDPLRLNGKFLTEPVDKSLADIAVGSDIVRKDSYINPHYSSLTVMAIYLSTISPSGDDIHYIRAK
jgi:hypothetical protein